MRVAMSALLAMAVATCAHIAADPWLDALPWPASASDIVRLPSGVEYRKIDTGPRDGGSPTDSDIVLVHFEGRLEDPDFQIGETPEERLESSLIVSTYQEGEPKQFLVSDLTAGWSEVIKLMRPGDRWIARIRMPFPGDEEGAKDFSPSPVVIYEIELLAVRRPDSPQP